MKNIFRLLLISIIGLTSCNNYKEVKTEDLNSAFILNSSPTFKGYYYKGSDSDFDYFVSKWDFEKDRYFKIATNKVQIIDSLKFDKNENELRIDLFKGHGNEFARTDFYTLYIQDTLNY